MEEKHTIGFEYSGNLWTSFNAFSALSLVENETKACPRILKLLCAITSITSPYDLNKPRSVAFKTIWVLRVN